MFDLEGARQTDDLLSWLVELLGREPGANRSLAAILKGQRPILDRPVLLPLDSLPQSAGPGPEYKWPKDPGTWEAQIAPLLALEPESLPPLLVRETGGEIHVPDGNHRLDAWRRKGLTHGWAIVWRDRDPVFKSSWSPFPPHRMPRLETVDPARVRGFLPPVENDGLVLAALVGEEVVGAVRLVPEFGTLTLRTMRVAEAYRGVRLGARILFHLQPHMAGRTTYCLAYPWLERFYGEFGFLPVDLAELPQGLRERYALFQDERGCLALRRNPS